jgi:hypothetical protein
MEQFIYATEALNQILVAADCPDDVRSFIDYLIGFSNGREEFEGVDSDVAKYMQTEDRRDNEKAAKSFLQRRRKKLEDWQEKNSVVFVVCIHGGRDKNRVYYPSRYQLPILNLIEMVMNKAQEKVALWEKQPLVEIKKAAQDLIKLHKADLLKNIIRTPYIRPPYVEMKQRSSAVKTHLEKMSKLSKTGNLKFGIDERELDEMEAYINLIRENNTQDKPEEGWDEGHG